ncbi:rhodanese-like domain-containing protein [Aurantibacter sp.]|uniref:rhodanese-like domain-containing protein n=1 Tax=Aurantibacter sp. TaxID=2807103 RepID=UPI003266A14F
MKTFFTCAFLLLMISSCAQSKEKPITELSQNDVDSGILIDVRTPDEFKAGHLDNALNMNWFDEDFKNKFQDIPKDKTIYVYCKMGGRSAKAANLLDSLGYENVINLTGGYDAYAKNK